MEGGGCLIVKSHLFICTCSKLYTVVGSQCCKCTIYCMKLKKYLCEYLMCSLYYRNKKQIFKKKGQKIGFISRKIAFQCFKAFGLKVFIQQTKKSGNRKYRFQHKTKKKTIENIKELRQKKFNMILKMVAKVRSQL